MTLNRRNAFDPANFNLRRELSIKALNRITEAIGKTPLLRLHEVYAKCEFFNPLSIKDRPMLHVINEAERKDLIKPGSTLIESTSGFEQKMKKENIT